MKFISNKNLVLKILTICLLAIFLSPQITYSGETAKDLVTGGLQTTANTGGIDTSKTDLPTILGQIINYFLVLVGVIFLTVVLIGGYLWLTAGGNEEKVGKAKKLITNGINGMVVVFLAYALVFVIVSSLKGAAE